MVLGEQVEHLAADHAGFAGRLGQGQGQFGAHLGIGVGIFFGQHLEGLGQQRIAGQDRRRLVEFDVTGGFAAAQFVIVHGWQVVMDE